HVTRASQRCPVERQQRASAQATALAPGDLGDLHALFEEFGYASDTGPSLYGHFGAVCRSSPERSCSSGGPSEANVAPRRRARSCYGRTRSPITSSPRSARPPSRCSKLPHGGSPSPP